MIDIVIPTMMSCKLEALKYSVYQALISDHIKRIVIIDNSGNSKFSKDLDFYKDIGDKLVVRTMDRNIYVNPAWNLGVSLCGGPNVLIMNDDVFCHEKVYGQVDKVMNQLNVGICSVKTENCQKAVEYLRYIDDFDELIKSQEEFDHPNGDKTGWFFCIKKKIWKDIPSELKLFYGDDLIFKRTKHMGYYSKNITSCRIGHMFSQTVGANPEANRKLRDEHNIYLNTKKEYVERP